jgi:hypothetical protein
MSMEKLSGRSKGSGLTVNLGQGRQSGAYEVQKTKKKI